MSLPQEFSNPYFQAKYHILYQSLSPTLKLLSDLSQASKSFLILWEEDYQQIFDQENQSYSELNIDCRLFKDRFSSLSQEVIYVPDVKFHTLFRNIEFFRSLASDQLLIYPLIDKEQQVKGIMGIIPTQPDELAFDVLVRQMESVGTYLNQLFRSYLEDVINSSKRHFNLEDLPISFFEAEINSKHEVPYSSFSKTLIRKHPAFTSDSSKEKRIEKLLCMAIPDFYALIDKIQEKQNMEYIYASTNPEGVKKYYLIKLHVSQGSNKHYRILAVMEDFTIQKAYGTVLDQMIFDISHVMRRPLMTMKGLTNLIDTNKMDTEELKEITCKIKTVSNEMEDYIKAMFRIYEAKQGSIYHF